MWIVMAAGVAILSTTGPQASPRDTVPLFASDAPLELTLEADFRQLRRDRRGETPERPARVRVVGSDGDTVTLPARLRTRGNFRRDPANCSFPPLRLNLEKGATEGTPFAGQDKLKVVGVCRPNRRSYEQLVLLEYLTYRAYALLTEASFRTRLARVTYVDTSGEDEPFTRYAFFIEDDDALASRMGATAFELEEGKNLPPQYFDPVSSARMAIFQYMIGNTDWSDVAGHNIQILDMGGVAVPVPYDFDFSGLVDAPYAVPDPDLGIRSVRERLYRGWCWPGLDVGPILEEYRTARSGILGLFQTVPDLDDGERGRAVRYLEAFFEEIETDARAQRTFLRDCRPLPR